MPLTRFDNGECYQDLEKVIVLLSIVFHVVTVKSFKYWSSLPPFLPVVQPQHYHA
jgi:hypothetical protein